MEKQGEIILYQPDEAVKLEVRLEDETVWLNRQQLSELFDRDIKTIGKHISNALKEELIDIPTGSQNLRQFKKRVNDSSPDRLSSIILI